MLNTVATSINLIKIFQFSFCILIAAYENAHAIFDVFPSGMRYTILNVRISDVNEVVQRTKENWKWNGVKFDEDDNDEYIGSAFISLKFPYSMDL